MPLTEFTFAPNPGNLRALASPASKGSALVVVLHGCGQTGQGYDSGTGWSQLAAQCGFAVLAIKQRRLNNPGTCFNWFMTRDTRRGEGEAASIAAAIQHMIQMHGLDAGRVFITGLSAGGAMTAVMLACYPEMFAAGAIIAGMPYGAAHGVRDALEAMKRAPVRTPHQWGDAVRAASPNAKRWPRVSIWHGALDMTVNVSNAQASVAQWADVHGLALTAGHPDFLGTAMRLSWGDRLELITIPALAHGVPIDSHDLGVPAPFILDVGLSSTRHIADFFGLTAHAQSQANASVMEMPELVAARPIRRLLRRVFGG